MPEWLILIFVLYIIYIIMKKSKTTTEKPALEATDKQPSVTEASKATPKKPSPAQPAPKKTPTEAAKPVAMAAESATPEAKTDPATATKATKASKAAPKKPSPAQPAASKKAPTEAPKPVEAAPELAMPERVGLTAGSVWHYLAENGATPVAKLVKELTEEEKVVQRSIGWLAQEGKITLATVDRVETLALKD